MHDTVGSAAEVVLALQFILLFLLFLLLRLLARSQ
jgi:hypothetical protein